MEVILLPENVLCELTCNSIASFEASISLPSLLKIGLGSENITLVLQ